MIRRARGLTVIEIVIAIAVVALLAAVAWPQFRALKAKAREARAQGLFGAVGSAAALTHAGCLANLGGACTPENGSVNIDGFPITMVNRFPSASASLSPPGGILLAAHFTGSGHVTSNRAGDTLTIEINGGAPGRCTVTYVEAPPGGKPSISLNTDGC